MLYTKTENTLLGTIGPLIGKCGNGYNLPSLSQLFKCAENYSIKIWKDLSTRQNKLLHRNHCIYKWMETPTICSQIN